MSEFCIGIEDHYAWANFVSVALSGARETLLDKRRAELLDAGLPASPYHRETRTMAAAAAEALVRTVQSSANERALSALATLLADLSPATCRGIAIRTATLT